MRGLSVRLALLAGLFICVSAAALHAFQPPSPAVAMSVALPDGKLQHFNTFEGGLVTVTVGGREYGFRPTMHDDAGQRMTITVFDMGTTTEAVKEIGSVDVRGGAGMVPTKTTPASKVQASKGANPRTT